MGREVIRSPCLIVESRWESLECSLHARQQQHQQPLKHIFATADRHLLEIRAGFQDGIDFRTIGAPFGVLTRVIDKNYLHN